MSLRPFWPFYGGKWRLAPRYPAPRHSTIVEPFAGAAGYATRYADRDIVLVDRDPVIVALWRYLIAVSPAEILALPLDVEDTRELHVCEEARHLIGWWLNKGTPTPRFKPSAWTRSGVRPKSVWGAEVRERIASQVESIRHWRVIFGDYHSAPSVEATWFVDPPYANAAGEHYRFGASARTTAPRGCRSPRSLTSTGTVDTSGLLASARSCGFRRPHDRHTRPPRGRPMMRVGHRLWEGDETPTGKAMVRGLRIACEHLKLPARRA